MAGDDERPVFAIGHMHVNVDDVGEAYAFFAKYGMRGILERPAFAILELRGGTHLILSQAEDSVEPGQRAPFDLMVDDVDAVHARFVEDGVAATEIERGNIHDSFSVTGPSGYTIPFNSSHVAGVV
ncbi:MAG: VOC family protein [Gammaproteobacteria bacterium]|nr:VOC family protein [Gammaproteobacteria bacterium]